jgi:hypothetical protein
VHPDRNLHPGAAEAFRKLTDTYEKLAKGKAKNSRALSVKGPTEKGASEKKLPKIISVKTNQ